MEIIEGGVSFENLRNKAYWTAAHLDSNHFNPKVAKDDYKAFLQAKGENRVVGDIALYQYLNKDRTLCDEYIRQNIKKVENEPGVKKLAQFFRKSDAKNYPKTGEIRQMLLENDRFRLDYVKPKLNKIEKFLIKLANKLPVY